MSFKMVVLDMDGTLLDNAKKVPPENQEVLRDLHGRGIEIVIATGRRYRQVRDILHKLGIPLTVIANSGTSLWKLNGDHKLSAKYMAAPVFYRILKEGYKYNLSPVLHVDHYEEGCDLISECGTEHPRYGLYVSGASGRHQIIKNLLDYKNPKVMIMCYFSTVEILKSFEKNITKVLPGQIHTTLTLTLKKTGPILEITPPYGTKWDTVVEYAQTKGIKPSEIVGIGDDSNDVKLLKNCGLGIAMKNAASHVKEAADIVTEYTNNEAGVAYVLRKIFSL